MIALAFVVGCALIVAGYPGAALVLAVILVCTSD